MARLNLTLDGDMLARLDARARKAHSSRAAFARKLLDEALEHREAIERHKLATDYAVDRVDARELVEDVESGELETLE